MMLLIMIVQEPNRCAKIPAGHTCYNGVGIWDGCTAFLNRRHGVPLRASPISSWSDGIGAKAQAWGVSEMDCPPKSTRSPTRWRSEEHTSDIQSLMRNA